MMKKILTTGCIILYCFLLSIAQQVPDHHGEWVIDNADMLTEQTERTLTALLQSHEESTTNQVVVLTVKSLEGGSLEEYSNRVFNTWKIGQKGRDNGVLLLIAKKDRAVRIEVGYGLEGDLTDLEAAEIINNAIIPKFKDGDFDQGVLNGVQGILDAINGTYQPIKRKKDFFSSKDKKKLIILTILFCYVYSIILVKIKGLLGLGCSLLLLIPSLILVFFYFSNPMNWIIFTLATGLFILLRIFGKKEDLNKRKGKKILREGSIWKGGGWLSGGGSSWGGGGFYGGGGFSGGGGASGSW